MLAERYSKLRRPLGLVQSRYSLETLFGAYKVLQSFSFCVKSVRINTLSLGSAMYTEQTDWRAVGQASWRPWGDAMYTAHSERKNVASRR
jgi:hypothetical protein